MSPPLILGVPRQKTGGTTLLSKGVLSASFTRRFTWLSLGSGQFMDRDTLYLVPLDRGSFAKVRDFLGAFIHTLLLDDIGLFFPIVLPHPCVAPKDE